MSPRAPLALLVALGVAAPAARADDDPARAPGWHGSLTVGGALLATGRGARSRVRGGASLELLPGGRWRRLGVVLAARHLTLDDGPRDALLTVGLAYQAAAARPRLALSLHADLGLTVADPAPAAGAGVRLTAILIGPLAVVGDLGAHLVVDGVDATRLALAAGLAVGVAR
ncbi:MAG: hypothetical protein R2939_03385 [Kofleriaceae bacterium]